MTDYELLQATVEERLRQIYQKSLEKCVERQNKLFKTLEKIDTGVIKPPQWYVDNGTESQWREQYVLKLLRQQNVIDACVEEITKAGGQAKNYIRNALVDTYSLSRSGQIGRIADGAVNIGYNPTFYQFNRKQMQILVSEQQPPFSKISLSSLENKEIVKRNLQQVFGRSIVQGYGRDAQADAVKKMLQNNQTTFYKPAWYDRLYKQVREASTMEETLDALKKVNDRMLSRAKTIAQTEMCRVQSEAEYEADQEALDKGIQLQRVWHCRFQNTRESHAVMEGQTVEGDEPFISGDGNELRFPADPLCSDPADVINCHCGVITQVKSHSDALARIRAKNALKRQNWLKQHDVINDDGSHGNWRGEGTWR